MCTRLYLIKYIAVVIVAHLSLICLYHLWYSADRYTSIRSTRHSKSLEGYLNAGELWLLPYDRNLATHASQASLDTLRTTPNDPDTWQFVVIGTKRIRVEGHAAQHISWRQAMNGSEMEHAHMKTVVLFEHCAHSDMNVTYKNIYMFYDSIVSCAAQLAQAFPFAVVLFISSLDLVTTGHHYTTKTQHHKSSRNVQELELLHRHLSYSYLMGKKGLLVANYRQVVQSFYSEPRERNKMGSSSQGIGPNLRYTEVSKEFNVPVGILRHLDYQIYLIIHRIGSFAELVELQHKKLLTKTQTLHSLCAKYYLNRKYDPHCHPQSALTHAFLVTGLGGAGTHFAARQLRMQGWRVLHEDLDRDGAVSWLYAANDWSVQSDYPYGALPPGESSFLTPRFGHVVHLVRNPLDQISSFTAHSNKSYNFVLRTMELFLQQSVEHSNTTEHPVARFQKSRADQDDCHRGGDCHLEFAALSWLHWNQFVHSFADVTFRVDQVQALQEHVCRVASAAACVTCANSSLPLQPLMTTRRYCEIKDCPSVNGGTQPHAVQHAVEKLGFTLLDRAFGVCALNEALFRRSAVHKRHRKYNWNDIARIDVHLAQDIQTDAVKYGFQLN